MTYLEWLRNGSDFHVVVPAPSGANAFQIAAAQPGNEEGR